MTAGTKPMVKDRYCKWLAPVSFLLFTIAIWLVWIRVDPRLAAIRYVSSSPFRNYICGFQTFELFGNIHGALPFLVWIGGAFSVISIGVVLIQRKWLGFVVVFGVTAIVYTLGASLNIQEQSGAPHFVYLADAFNHGNLVLEARPPEWEENDWTEYEGEWSVSFPPAPAILMMPFVAISGKSFNDVIFTLILGAFNAALFFELVPRVGNHLTEKIDVSKPTQIFITIGFAFGTIHWWLSSFGQVWFTAQIVATTFLLLALLETFGQQRPFGVGLWLSLAALARPPILLALPVFAWLLLPKNPARKLAWGLIPLAVVGIGMGVYNFVRYNNPLELGYQYMQLEYLLAKRIEATGSFNLIYLPENLHNAFWKMPEFRNTCPYVVMDGWGLSMLFSTPLLLLIILAPWREKAVYTMATGALLVAIPSFLYYNTGYLQAGYRYALDFLPMLFVPLIAATRGRLNWKTACLVALSVAMGFLSLLNFYLLSYEII
jgi:hypothetical protein